VGREPAVAAIPWAPRDTLRRAAAALTGPSAIATRSGIAVFLCSLVAVVALAYAGVAVSQAAYASKPLFHSFGDYVTLFSAALASSAAATVLGIVAYWRPAPADPS
jgi:hypothetical protein